MRWSRSRVGSVRSGRVPSEGSERQYAVRRSRCRGRLTDSCLAQSRGRTKQREGCCADEAGATATMVSDVSEDSTRTAAAAAAATRAGMCLMYTGRLGWRLVYDDVCGQQAIECWMQASAQKQEVKRGTTQQTRQAGRWSAVYGERNELRPDYILRSIITANNCARAKRRWRGRGWRSRVALESTLC